MAEYKEALGNLPFAETLSVLEDEQKELQRRSKIEVEAAGRKDKKRVQAYYDELIAEKAEAITVAKEAAWLYGKFGEGEYRDIPGLC